MVPVGGDVGLFERGKSKHRPRNDKRLFADGKCPFIQTGDVARSKNHEFLIQSFNRQYNDFGLSQSRIWKNGTWCITIAANIAETGFLGIDACFPDSVMGLTSLTNESTSNYVKFFIDVAKESLEKFAPSTAQKNINRTIIGGLIFPLPPINEQQRIVKKVDQLMAMCSDLENQLQKSTDKQTHILDAVLAEV